MAEQLASVPEESATGFAAPLRPRSGYRDRIQTVPVSGAPKRWTGFPLSRSGHNGSSYSTSGASNSCPSNNSAGSGGTAPVVFASLRDNDELTWIARQMVSDGYTGQMVQAFDEASSSDTAPALKHGDGSLDHALKNWFLELDVDWVLQIHDRLGLQRLLQEKPESTPQDLVERWIRALSIIVTSITELKFPFHGRLVVARFGKASIAEMLVFVDAILPLLKAENLHAVLDMFTCVLGASYMFTSVVISPEVQSIFSEIGVSLQREVNKLSEAISGMMEEVRTLMEDDEPWAIKILRGRGEVHTRTQFMMDCIASMINARTSMANSTGNHNTENLGSLIDGTINYLKELLLRESESCSDPSLRYLFLLNSSNFLSLAWSGHQSHHQELELTPECKMYMDRYLDVSWRGVMSCISEPGLCLAQIYHWNIFSRSSLDKFHSAFHKTYKAHKFWKVSDPRLRSLLRDTITKTVIPDYRDYLKDHPKLEKHVRGGSNSPDVLEEMLRELFEG
ncbi:hypothetical protein ACQJBY_012609 [Aegilops geniculata]